MQVSLTATGGLERKLEVAVPAEKVAAEVDQRLKKLARTARFNGFRPGKAPMGVVRQQYGTQVHSEVVNDLLRSSFADAVSQEKLKPATGPRIQPIALDPGADLKYVATFEVLPDIKLAPVDSLAIERATASVTDADIDEMLESLRKQRPVYQAVERGAKTTDRVQIDFDGRIGGETFQGGEGRDVPVVLGGGQVLAEFEQALSGAKAGDVRSAVVHFPDDYHGRDVAGKTAEFTITVKGVEEMSLPALDDAFAGEFGVKEGGVAKLREEVRESMERELADAVRNQLRAQVIAAVGSREKARKAEAYGAHHVIDYSVEDTRQQIKRLTNGRGVDVVVGTPGRVIDHLERGTLDLSALRCLVLDEADEMLRMGFIDDVETVLKKIPEQRQIALFSATMPTQIKRIAQTYLRDPIEIAIKAKTTTAAGIRQRYWLVSGVNKLDALTRILEAEPFAAMLVFARTKQGWTG